MGHAALRAGSEGWLGHYLTWFVPGVGEFFHFTWGLERKQGPYIWGIITLFFYSKANAPYFPGVGGVGVSIDRCIIGLTMLSGYEVRLINRRNAASIPLRD